MRIVLDLQGAQSESRVRGIGRYSLSFAQAFARTASRHEVIVALNARLVDTIEPIRAAFDDLLPQSQIRTFHVPGPVRDVEPGTAPAREAAERIREAFLASLDPDFVHVSSLFEGFGDDAVTSIGVLATSLPTAVTLYDLIPLTIPHPNPAYGAHYERKLQSFRRAALWLGISQHSCDEAVRLLGLPAERVVNISCAADPQFARTRTSAFAAESLRLALGISRPFICCVGAPEARKNVDVVFAAVANLPPVLRVGHQIVLAGHMQEAERDALMTRAAAFGLTADEVVFTGHVTDRHLVLLYNTCQVFVFPSLHEGFGLPALEAMQCGAPVLASNASSIPEVVGLADAMFDPHSVEALTAALTRVLTDEPFRQRLIGHGLTRAQEFSWERTAHRALHAMERQHAQSPASGAAPGYDDLVRGVAEVLVPGRDSALLRRTALAIARNQPRMRPRRLFVDVSELVQRDAGTGVQRVTRSVLQELLRTPPDGFDVQPVYATVNEDGYRFARRFARERFGVPRLEGNDSAIDWTQGDIFFGLDLQHHVVLRQQRYYREMRAGGVSVYFLIHDLLPLLLPEHFPPGAGADHQMWLSVLAESDGVVCVSRVVADQFIAWLEDSGIERMRPLRVGWSHSGADLESSLPSRGLPDGADRVLARIAAVPTFLMVGTIEPRKGHLQTLRALEQLWAAGEDVNLVIVGRRGWMMGDTIERLATHHEFGSRLFWLEGISDEFLQRIYAASVCLIAASEGEGYGLPLVEAARHGLPILARDLAVFREVAGEHASYFSGRDPAALAGAILEWLALRAHDRHPRSAGIRILSWEESVERLKRILLGDEWYASWPAPAGPAGAAAGGSQRVQTA